MFDAQLLMAIPDEGCQVFSPWFPRGGDFLRATLEIVASGGANLDVEIFTKNNEDTGNGTPVPAPAISRTAKGRYDEEWGPDQLLELVRYRFTATGDTAQWVLFRMLPPVWFDAAAAP
jgi:hypothetical protein